MKRTLTGLMSTAIVLGAGAAHADADALERHRALWSEAGVDDYVYAYQKHCECHRDTPPETVVTVRGGEIARVHHEHADSDRRVPAREGSLDLYWTVEGLFGLIGNALAAEASVRASYDAELGHPLEIFVDYDPELVGDEVDLRITRLRAAGRAAP